MGEPSEAANDRRSAIAASVVLVGIGLNVDILLTLFTDWNAMAFWFPPLSNSFISYHGMLFPASPGLAVGGTVTIMVWIFEVRTAGDIDAR